jgi:hypothetical protein
MRPLAVFLIDNEDKLLKVDELSKDEGYHRFFVLSNKTLTNLINFKKTDSIITYDFKISQIDIIIKMIVACSNSMYDHIIIFLAQEFDFDNQIKNFSHRNTFQNEEAIGFTRQSFIFDNLNFIVDEKVDINPYERFEMMDTALSGEKVNSYYFKEALKELLPNAEYKYQDDLNIDDQLKNIIQSKFIKSNSQFLVSNKNEDLKNLIIFTSSEIDKFKFVIRREDGLNCYIL